MVADYESELDKIIKRYEKDKAKLNDNFESYDDVDDDSYDPYDEYEDSESYLEIKEKYDL